MERGEGGGEGRGGEEVREWGRGEGVGERGGVVKR